MFRALAAASIVLVLVPGCAGAPAWFPRAFPASGQAGGKPALARYSFEWRLSGSREVAPLQVFDDGRRTWLQFAPQQPVPAIFEWSVGLGRPLSYTREGPYVVLDGVWPELMLRGGALQSLASRATPSAAPAPPIPAPGTAMHAQRQPVHAPVSPSSEPPPEARSAAVSVPAAIAPADLPDAPAAAQGGEPGPGAGRYQVGPGDGTLRAALAKWAATEGWTFEPEHWTIDADIPIVGSASFAPPFKHAVQELVASTELADRPLQPCFYSNRVLRIVPYAQPCDRTAASPGES